ncbi:hypothetical protein EDD15DRAFT_2403278 [Pisolithus albus]|nr:hypothetical protein EDD15DRAFT_2403278 [Pisolithus albus]
MIAPDMRKTRIKCIGVWDTVGAILNMVDALGIVDTALHVVSLQDNRDKFLPTLWQIPPEGLSENQILKQIIQDALFHESLRVAWTCLEHSEHMVTPESLKDYFGESWELSYVPLNEFEWRCKDSWVSCGTVCNVSTIAASFTLMTSPSYYSIPPMELIAYAGSATICARTDSYGSIASLRMAVMSPGWPEEVRCAAVAAGAAVAAIAAIAKVHLEKATSDTTLEHSFRDFIWKLHYNNLKIMPVPLPKQYYRSALQYCKNDI